MVTEPTGLEHLTPVKITDTSATERAGFRKCRRQWFLTTVHRLDPQQGSVNFFIGNLYHWTLRTYYLRLQAGETHEQAVEGALDEFQMEYDRYVEKLREQLGFVWKIGEPVFREAGELTIEMAQNYFDAELVNPLFDEIVAVEFRVNVAIRSPKGRRVGWLSVQADAVGRKNGELIVVDHKTASREMSSAMLDLDDQLTAEVFSWWEATGDFPEKAVYNVAYKKAPHPPKQIRGSKAKPVKLSRDKQQGTTYALYTQEVARLGLDPADYEDILAYLKELDDQGENVFFRREAVFRTPGQMTAFRRDLYHEYRDMRDVAAHPEKAYPNPTSFNCPGCPVRVICTTIQDDGDVSAIIKAGYVISDPRR